jgi:hypothetical protein
MVFEQLPSFHCIIVLLNRQLRFQAPLFTPFLP